MKKPPQEEKLKLRQINILILLYKYRFLNRIQIQKLLNHKQFNRVIIWLNEMTGKKYLKRYYSKRLAPYPAVYSLGVKGRKYLKEIKDKKGIQTPLLDRVWKEYTYSESFRNHCLFLADIYISLLSLVNKTKAKLTFYTKTELTNMQYLILPEPDAYFSIRERTGLSKGYFLDIFNYYSRDKWLVKRAHQYFNYFSKEYWQDYNSNPFPEIVLVCPDNSRKGLLERVIKKGLKGEENLTFYLTTWSDIKHQGMNRQVLHKVEID